VDLINALFELGGGLAIIPSIARAWRQGQVSGVHPLTPVFFWTWSLWNIFYYPALGQWMSFVCGTLCLISNSVWLMCVLLFSHIVVNNDLSIRERS
jgi:hypothetical protein